MLSRKVIVLALIFSILIVQCIAVRWDMDSEDDDYVDDDDDDEKSYRSVKRFFFHKSSSTSSTQRPPSAIENLIHPTTTKQSSSWTQKTTHSPVYPSSNPCSSDPCNNGGICTPKGQLTFECKCVGPWRGIYCGIADACKKSPCQNGGTCLNVADDYWCKCSNDYYGTNCEKKFSTPDYSENNCRPYICNTGQCVSLKTTYYCKCPDDRYGQHCEKRFSKRGDTVRQSYYNLLHQLKRGNNRQDLQKPTKNPDVAYYDVKNRIYFKRK